MKQNIHKKASSPDQIILNVWAVSMFIWALYRYTFKTDFPVWFDEFIAKPLVFFTPLFWFFRSQSLSFFPELSLHKKQVKKDVSFGFVIGGIIFVGAIAIHSIKNPSTALLEIFNMKSISVVWLIAMIAAAISEQLLSTGFVLNQLIKVTGKTIRSVLISALLFSFLHIPTIFSVQKISGVLLVQVLLFNIVLSLLTSLVFLIRKSVIAPIIIHAVYLISLPVLL